MLMNSLVLNVVFEDYCVCKDLVICEGYFLIVDQLNLLQQISGVICVNGVVCDYDFFKSFKQWLFNSGFLVVWVFLKLEFENSDERSDMEFWYYKFQ